MASKVTPRIWIGVGVAILIAGQTAVSVGQETKKPADAPGAAAAGHAGHGAAAKPAAGPADAKAPGGDSDDSGLDPRIKVLRDMGLIRGHLLVGNELVKASRWDDALPHFHHPVEELYPGIGPKLKEQKVRQFDGPLKALAQTVQAKNAQAYATAWTTVDRSMTDAEGTLRKSETPRAAARIATVVAILKVAGREYGEAIEDDKIAKPVEYQDSRGFVLYAIQLFETIGPELKAKDPAAYAASRTALDALKAAWPAPLPPEKPVMTPSAVVAAVSSVEAAMSPFTK